MGSEAGDAGESTFESPATAGVITIDLMIIGAGCAHVGTVATPEAKIKKPTAAHAAVLK